MKKIIGTLVPLSALWSRGDQKHNPTFETGRIFLDWLHETKQRAWQLLPLSETHFVPGNPRLRVPSPYKGYGVGLDPKYLSAQYKTVIPNKVQLATFLAENKRWLPDYALFCALHKHFKTDDWTTWPSDIRNRKPASLAHWKKYLSREFNETIIEQWRLHEDFKNLRRKGKRLGIQLIGDISFYLPLCSPLVWAYQEAFDIPRNKKLKTVSGLPDGPKAHFGRQVWGHPLYAWDKTGALAKLRRLWSIRLASAAMLFDFTRLDHAKGLYFFGAMDVSNPRRDRLKEGPGTKMFEYIVHAAKELHMPLFMEDSGDNLERLREDMHRLRIPGVRILRFAYNEKKGKITDRYARTAGYPQLCIAYTSTHDTETLLGYTRLLSSEARRELSAVTGAHVHRSAKRFAVELRNAILRSPARYAIVSLQDWLLTEDRINIPGSEKKVGDTNWQYKAKLPVEKFPKKNLVKFYI